MALAVLELLIILIISLIGAGSSNATCTSGFPERDRLVSDVDDQTGPATRLFPEMRFLCNGTIVGYTVAMSKQKGQLHPSIQTWRRNDPECQPNDVYYKESDVPITDTWCVDGLNEVANGSNVFHCNLIGTARISVQPGDILGLKLPSRTNDSGILTFANVGQGQSSYLFEELLLPIAVFSDGTTVANELPQINLEVESGSISECTSGFPDCDMLASELLDQDGHSDVTVTILIPEMKFTCNGILAGFTLTGINRRQKGEHQDPKVQIWRENISEPDFYYKVGSAIFVNISESGACANGLPESDIAFRTYFCILLEDFQVLLQPGDILGLELPPNHDNDLDILFTKGGGGPTNYVFRQPLNSSVHLSERDSEVQQLPQISLSLTTDNCTIGFLDTVSKQGDERGNSTKVTTRLFPDLIFGCSGTIVRIVVAVVNRNGQQSPKIQIWREDKNLTGIYYKLGHNIPVKQTSSICAVSALGSGIFRCTLQEAYQVSVQPGDILGLELPPKNDKDFVIYFKNKGPLNYVFEGQLNSTVNISQAAHRSHDLPQINLVVILENTNGRDESFIPLSCENQLSKLTTMESKSLDGYGTSLVGAILGSIIGCTVVAVGLAFVIAIAAVCKHHRKKHHSYNNNNHVIDRVKSIHGLYEISQEATTAPLPYVSNPTEPHDYEIPDSTKLQSSRTEQVVKLTELDSDFHPIVTQPYMDVEDHAYVIPTIEDCYSEENEHSQIKDSKEEQIYWEPATSVNELYKQLCSNKYREIAREQVEIGTKLGSGQFGIVSTGVWESPKGALDVAVKQLRPGASEEEKVKFLQEAAINGQFRHPNLVMLMGVVTVGEPVMIVLELLSNGDLRTFLVKCRPRKKKQSASVEVDEKLLLKFCQHVASGMSYLASKSFVHRDLAARNILVSQDKICKISDFGMSRNLVDEKYVSHGGIVPLKWMSPEAINYNKYSSASDVWSFGCVMYEIWSLGHRPFADLSNDEVLSAIEKGYRLPPPPGTSKEIYKIMIQCWQRESARRPTFPQLVELLSRADFELFAWEEEDLRNSDPMQVKTIGAPLEAAKDLYPDLQRSYIII